MCIRDSPKIHANINMPISALCSRITGISTYYRKSPGRGTLWWLSYGADYFKFIMILYSSSLKCNQYILGFILHCPFQVAIFARVCFPRKLIITSPLAGVRTYSSGDEIANVNFLRRHRTCMNTHTADSYIPSVHHVYHIISDILLTTRCFEIHFCRRNFMWRLFHSLGSAVWLLFLALLMCGYLGFGLA